MTALNELKEILMAEVAGHERLLELKRREREEVLRGTPQDLLAVLEQIRDTAAEIDSLEELRTSACRDLGRHYHLSNESPTLGEITATVPECRTAQWTDLQDRLRGLLEELARINQETRYLLRGSLTWVGGILGMLSGEWTAGPAYDGNGLGGGGESRPLLVNQTV